jgi:hypothetical protein
MALIAAFIAALAAFAMAVEWWETTWRIGLPSPCNDISLPEVFLSPR